MGRNVRRLFQHKSRAVKIVLGLGLLSSTFATVQVPAMAAVKSVTIPLPGMSSLDPTQWGAQILIDQGTILEGLGGYNQKNQIVPKIATHWTVTNGGKTWTFYLRKDAKWSNGDPVTADDFYYAWMRLASPQDSTGALWAGAVQYAVNAWAYHAGQVPASKVGLKVINKYTLQLTEATPHDLTGLLPLAGSMPLNKKVVDAHPTDWFLPKYFVGDGPYVVSSFTPNGRIELTRNPKYVGAKGQFNVGNADQINIIPTPTVPVEDFMANKMDVAGITNPADYQYVMNHPDLKAQLHKDPAYNLYYLEWDHSIDKSPLDNQLVRQAIAMAINKAPIADPVLNGMKGVANGFGPPGWPGVDKEKPLPYDVAKARQLMAKAGYANGKGIPTLYIYCMPAPDPTVLIAQAVAQELKNALNINVKINPTASQMYGQIVWGGLNKGVLPGYVIGSGTANWQDAVGLPMQANMLFGAAGTVGPVSYRKYISNWYFQTYDPVSVKKYGNPDDKTKGIQWSDWVPLQKAVQADNKFLTAWWKKQPKAYQDVNKPVPGQTTLDLWNGMVQAWKNAKTDADKHSAWVAAWKFVGNYSAGNGGTYVGLDGQVYEDQHEPKIVHDINMWMSELGAMSDPAQEAALSAKIVNAVMNTGYAVPLVYNENIYLERSNITGVQSNPWAWGNFYQLQYIEVK
ncbi:MAG: peptide ABC transporter substrate-binding protein [Alicyclobacillus sp.]|nr:peptide ABC transporter substrate-binding protein [Alicyclobacillus sp.]